MSTTSVPYDTNDMEFGRNSTSGNNCPCGDWSSDAYHDVSIRRSFPKSIAALLMFVYSSSAGMVPNGSRRYRNASLTTIAMHVDDISSFNRFSGM